VYKGYLQGHNGWVNCIKVGTEKFDDGAEKDFLITGGRDNCLIK
jgi:hypothetical protein